LKSKAFQGI